MLFALSSKVNSYYFVKFDHQSSADHMLFQQGRSMKGQDLPLHYEVDGGKALDKLMKMHFVESMGPQLVSWEIREALAEAEGSGEVEFLEASVHSGGQRIDRFSAMNVRYRAACTDMASSEYTITNFDPARPDYHFLYHVLEENFDPDLTVATQVAICDETPGRTVVSGSVVEQMKLANLKGMICCSALDMTPKGRSACIKL